MAVKTVETVASTAKRAIGFACGMFLLRQVVLLSTEKKPLSDVQVQVWQNGTAAHSSAAPRSVSLPLWLSDWDRQEHSFAGFAGSKVDYRAMDDKAFQRYLLEEESEWKNSLAFALLPEALKAKVGLDSWPLILRAWLRSFILANLIYIGLGCTWAYYIYSVYGHALFPTGAMPATGDILEQVKVSLSALPLYSFLPALCEHIVERGWTLAYVKMDEYSWPQYLAFFFAYMGLVEFGVYWNHRLLHDLRIGYDKLHYIHHKYVHSLSLSPLSSLSSLEI